jgi:hypothetical protein
MTPPNVLDGKHPASSAEYSYWENHYKCRGSSGEGSVGNNREWKWRTIMLYAQEIDDVIDIGCGDLSFWEDCKLAPKPSRYLGLDVSSTIIDRDRREYPDRSFRVADARTPILGLKARIVLCLDLLFHIMDDDTFVRILENLCDYSLDWIFVFTWCRNPFNLRWRLEVLYAKLVTAARMSDIRPLRIALLKLLWILIRSRQLGQQIRFLASSTESDGLYQKYRRFEDHFEVFRRNGFTLVAKHQNPYGTVGAMYVFHVVPPVKAFDSCSVHQER